MVSPQPSVFLFIGGDTYSKEKAIRKLGDSFLDSSARELDLKVFRGAQAHAREILDNLSTIPFLASRRLVIVKEFEKLSAEDRSRLAEYAKKPSKTACLILDSRDESILEDFRKISRQVAVKIFGEPTGSDLALWIKRFVSENGKSIEPGAIEFLKEAKVDSISQLSNELEKLVSFVGSREVIKASDVEELVGQNLVASVFDLTNAIEANMVDEALKVVSSLLTGGKKHFEIIGLLSWHVKRLLKAKTMQLKGCTDTYIANTLRINRKYFGRFFAQVKALKLAAIKSQMRILLDADLNIKRSKLDPALVLECAIIRLCLGNL